MAARTRALLLQGICRPFRLLFSDDGKLNGRPAERARLDGLPQTEVQRTPARQIQQGCWSQVLLGELAELVGNGTESSQRS